MQVIIHQILREMEEEILKCFYEGGLEGLTKDCENVHTIIVDATLKVLKAMCEGMDLALFDDKALRKEEGLKVHQRGIERTIELSIGTLTFKRTAYHKDGEEGLIYPVDMYIGLDKKEKVSKELSAKAVQEATKVSYSSSAENVSDGRISKQTVKNKVDEIGELAIDSTHEKRVIPRLDIYADEDHINMRKDKNHQKKYNKFLPIIVTAEGKTTNNNRNSLVNPIYFQGCGMDTNELWQGFGAFLREEYDVDHIPEIVLHSDGGNWIKGIDNELLGVTHVMDEFHIKKHIKKLCAGEIGKKYALSIYTAVDAGNIDGVVQICNEMLSQVEEFEKTEHGIQSRKKSIREERKYFINSKDSIIERELGHHTGSCTEGLVSHFTAERLSRNPMGWGSHGLAKLSMVMAYTKNGKKVPVEAIGQDKKYASGRNYMKPPARHVEKYINYFNEQAKLTGTYDWSIFDREETIGGKVEFRNVLMKLLNKGGMAV